MDADDAGDDRGHGGCSRREARLRRPAGWRCWPPPSARAARAEDGAVLSGTLPTIADARHDPDRRREERGAVRVPEQGRAAGGFSVDLCHGSRGRGARLEPRPAGAGRAGLADGPADRAMCRWRRRRGCRAGVRCDRPGVRIDDGQRRAGQDGRVLAGVLPGRDEADGPARAGMAGPSTSFAILAGQGGRGARDDERRGDGRAWRRPSSPPIEVVETPCLEAAFDMLAAARWTRWRRTISCCPASSRANPAAGRSASWGLPVVRALCHRLSAGRPGVCRCGAKQFRAHGGGRHAGRTLSPLVRPIGCRRGRPSACR